MKRKIIPYHHSLVPLARQLRQNMTIAEAMLWQELKQKKMLGMDFDRQKPILNYIVDFYCKDLMLAIEVDGGSHDSKQEADSKRQKELESVGVCFLRFREQEVRKDIVNVMYAIQNWIEEEMKHNGLRGRSAE
ncbi:MAG TPA: endonuclease domain-containing protein [Chitinophagaceae bacterium]|nr:endonuclease domain-containing protein [Chitinophagaceae bacterium]